MSDYKNITTIAAEIRENLKREFPKCKFSVRVERYSMGQSLHVALTRAPFEAFQNRYYTNGSEREREYAQLNELQFGDEQARMNGINNGVYITSDAWDTLKRVTEIVNADNWDRSDSQSDYFDVNYYTHLAIGKWDKPFEVAQ